MGNMQEVQSHDDNMEQKIDELTSESATNMLSIDSTTSPSLTNCAHELLPLEECDDRAMTLIPESSDSPTVSDNEVVVESDGNSQSTDPDLNHDASMELCRKMSFLKRSNAVRKKKKTSRKLSSRQAAKESLHNAILHDAGSDNGSGSDSGVTIAYFAESIHHSACSTMNEFQTNSVFGDTPTFTSFSDPLNHSKNRYTDIPCIERSRVKLIRDSNCSPGSNTLTDYIHANWVDGYRQKDAFICTQGPLRSTVVDFWHMVVQYRAPLIVMTTRPREQNRDKCYQYWPDNVGEMQIFSGPNDQCDTFEVFSLKTKEFGENCPENGACSNCPDHWYRVTLLLIKNTKTGEEHQVNHFYFHSWPDQGIPLSCHGFLHFILLIRQTYQQCISKLQYKTEMDQPIPPPPIVVHCSAGIGRTGTYIVIEICLKSLLDCGRFNLRQTMLKVRSQRFKCVQNCFQYTYCRDTIIEYARQTGMLPGECDNFDIEKKEQKENDEEDDSNECEIFSESD